MVCYISHMSHPESKGGIIVVPSQEYPGAEEILPDPSARPALERVELTAEGGKILGAEAIVLDKTHVGFLPTKWEMQEAAINAQGKQPLKLVEITPIPSGSVIQEQGPDGSTITMQVGPTATDVQVFPAQQGQNVFTVRRGVMTTAPGPASCTLGPHAEVAFPILEMIQTTPAIIPVTARVYRYALRPPKTSKNLQ